MPWRARYHLTASGITCDLCGDPLPVLDLSLADLVLLVSDHDLRYHWADQYAERFGAHAQQTRTPLGDFTD